jgi:hypothetical protein
MKEKLPFSFQAAALFVVCGILFGIFEWVSEAHRSIAESFRPVCSLVALFVTFLGCRFLIEFRGKAYRGSTSDVSLFWLGVLSTLLAFSVMIMGVGPPPARMRDRSASWASVEAPRTGG